MHGSRGTGLHDLAKQSAADPALVLVAVAAGGEAVVPDLLHQVVADTRAAVRDPEHNATNIVENRVIEKHDANMLLHGVTENHLFFTNTAQRRLTF